MFLSYFYLWKPFKMQNLRLKQKCFNITFKTCLHLLCFTNETFELPTVFKKDNYNFLND